MTAPIDPRVMRMAARLNDFVAELARKDQERLLRAEAGQREKARRIDAEIMAACKAVGAAHDALAQARFAGAPEIPARRRLERAAAHLATVMRRHGRVEMQAGVAP